MFGICKKKKFITILTCAVSVACLLTACNNSPQENIEETPSSTSSTSPQIEEVVMEIPEDFLDFQNYIGEDISLFGMEEELEEYDGGTSSLYGHTGTVIIGVGWDGRTITRAVLTFDDRESYAEDYAEIKSNIAAIFGEATGTYSGVTYYSGETDFDFALSIRTAAICWNIENRNIYDSKNPDQATSTTPGEKVSPTIGMTADEVLASTWGEPSDINRTTTRYGVSEQWVYRSSSSKTRYIYFDDGIVTAIQE